MGSPLGPLFANIFISFSEKSWLHNCPSSFKPLLYQHYVDDCFLLFRSPDHVPLFLSCLNCQHPNIFFSSELEKNGKRPFLDIGITRSNGKFSTSVYRKPTFTGLFTNFHSFVSLVYKRSLVCCLLHRIFHLCSSYETISSNPNHLSSQFPRKSSIFAFLSPVHTPFRFALKCSAAYPHLNVSFVFRILGISPITGKPSSNPPMSSIFSHLKTTGHSASFDDFQILDCEIMIHESLLISKLKPTLNVQGNSIPLNLL